MKYFNVIEPDKDNLYDVEALKEEKLWGINNVHDPGIYKDGEWYYVFSTDADISGKPGSGVQVRKSKDLIHWEWVGHAFEGVPYEAKEWTQAEGLWAPDVTKIGDTYYLYYAASQFGKTRSFIGVATSNSVEGPWEDQGEVFKTYEDDVNNAIDPNIIHDTDGKIWMCYGSFFGGIYISEINPANGKLLNYGRGKLLAKRNFDVDRAIEGPYIIYNEKFKMYYLFVSYDSLFNDYNVRVGRSKNILGPYVDYDNNDLTNIEMDQMEVGTKILGAYRFNNSEGWLAPGHNSVLKDGNEYFIVHHARGQKDKRWHFLHIREILWSDDGWPLVSPERYSGEKEVKIERDMLLGEWETIILDKHDNLQLVSNKIVLLENGEINYTFSNSFWKLEDDNTLILHIYDPVNIKEGDYSVVKMKVIPGWDWENWKPTLVCTGINQLGVSMWGKRR